MLDLKVQEEYNNRFSEEEKLLLKNIGISPIISNKYDERFNACDIKNLFHKRGIFPEQLNEYNKRFDKHDIMKLAWARCSPSEAEKYPMKFKGKEIAILFRTGVSAEQAKNYWQSYCRGFNGYEISNLVRGGCSADQAFEYSSLDEPPLLDGYVISLLHLLKMTPEMIKS